MTPRVRLGLACLGLSWSSLVVAGCQPKTAPPGGASSSATASAPAAAPTDEATLARLREAEQRRAPAMIEDQDVRARSAVVRRAAARALARIAGQPAREKLFVLLSDEDPEVIQWAAYGLGFDCADAREATVSALVARVLSLGDAPGFDDAFTAIARAVGACGVAERSEATLMAWLDGPPARARGASLGLGDLAGRANSKKLREETWVALFSRAAGGVSTPPLPEALYPVSRVENVPPTVVERLAEVASARLGDKGPYRLFAVRALGRAKDKGLAPLERVLLADGQSFTMPERVEAARAAARLGDDGAVLLGRALDKLAALPSETIAAGGDETQVLLAALGAIKQGQSAKKALSALAVTNAKPGSSTRALRVLSLVRCAAAKALPDVKASDAALLGCDLTKGPIGKRALLEVLGRSELNAAGLARFRELAKDPDPRTREAALELLPTHEEIAGAHLLLADALGAKEPGVVSTAAEQIAKRPALASARAKPARKKDKADDKPKPDDKPASPETNAEPLPPPASEVVKALVSALDRAEKEHDLEMLTAVLDAIGALGQRSLLTHVERFCGSAQPTAREHARNAIALLNGGKKPACEPPAKADTISQEALENPAGVTLSLETDVGPLTIELDPSLAPAAVARVVALVKRGYYDGNVLHRVDPSFVVQFGSPFADGYAGPPDVTPLRCETSPRAFEALSVGVALSGRDTGQSQLFIMRARHPHLDGLYPIIGSASGPWDKILEGDSITKASIK